MSTKPEQDPTLRQGAASRAREHTSRGAMPQRAVNSDDSMAKLTAHPRMLLAGVSAAFAAAFVGFLIHVGTQVWIQAWISERMGDAAMKPSWDVRYLAFVTSFEVGAGLVTLYALVRRSIPVRSAALRGLLLGALLLAVMGRLLRQPIMDLAVGNPASVVMVQDGVSWILWLTISVVAAVVFERLAPEQASRP